MFEKVILHYMTKQEYKQLIQKYMDKYNISYISAIQKIEDELMQRDENEFNKLLLDAYNDIIENGHNISML